MSDEDKIEPPFKYNHVRTSKYPHQLALSQTILSDIAYESLRNAVVIYIDIPLEDTYSESYMVQPSVRRWIEEAVPNHHEDFDFNGDRAVFRFKHKQHAMMFKLAFANGLMR